MVFLHSEVANSKLKNLEVSTIMKDALSLKVYTHTYKN
jgi:hypothetical protein